jgi:hypothetical protein
MSIADVVVDNSDLEDPEIMKFPRLGIVNFSTTVHNEAMAQDRGWFSYTGAGDTSQLTDEQRQVVEDRIRDRGQLLGVVQVRVYENKCEPCVTFPQDAVLGVETDQSVIAEMVARARTRLVDWR